MDLGIKGKQSIVCASSKGLGKACAAALLREGCDVVINARDEATLQATAEELAQLGGGQVTTVAGDLNTQEGRAKLLEACPNPDILVNNNAGPPPGAFDKWVEADWQAALQANLLAPVFMIQGVLPGMRQRKFGRIVNITSAMVKSPHAAMGLSTTARSGLTACALLEEPLVHHQVFAHMLRAVDFRQQHLHLRLVLVRFLQAHFAFLRPSLESFLVQLPGVLRFRQELVLDLLELLEAPAELQQRLPR